MLQGTKLEVGKVYPIKANQIPFLQVFSDNGVIVFVSDKDCSVAKESSSCVNCTPVQRSAKRKKEDKLP